MAEYPNEAYAPAMQVYKKLEGISDLHKAAANAITQIPEGGKPLSPYDLLQQLEPLKTMSEEGLKRIIGESANGKKEGGLEARTQAISGSWTPTQYQSIIGLGFVGLLLSYLPYII